MTILEKLVIPGQNDVNQAVELYDESSGYDDETGIEFAPGLSVDEIKQATMIYRIFNELWGLALIVGDPGHGKDIFGNVISYKTKRYFPWKRILRDEMPRELFGPYAGLFNEEVLSEDLARMRAVAKGKKTIREQVAAIEKAVDDWVSERGQVLLKHSLLYLTEFWRYCYNREPHAPMNKTMGGIHKEKRHLDCLILGTVQQISDLDRFTCLPWVDWQVTCNRSVTNNTGFFYLIQRVKYDRRMMVLRPIGPAYSMAFDGGKPRTYLGDGKIKIKKPNYKPETDEERIVLDVIKAGADTYEVLVDYIYNHGDMTEDEVLVTLKELALRLPQVRRPKYVLSYPCFFGLYNSKSAPQMRSTLKSAGD